MKTLTQLLALTAGAALTVLTAQAAIILDTDYTAAQGYVNGSLSGQLGSKWAASAEQVDTNGSGTVTNSGGFDWSGYLQGARSGTNTPSATGGFNPGDVLKFTFDYQFSVPGTASYDCARVGVRGGNSSGGPTNGLALDYQNYQASTGGSLRFYPSMADRYGSLSYALYLNGTNFGLDAANYFGNGVKTNSDPMRIYYQMTCLGAGVWQLSLAVSNKVSGRSWSYSGPTRYITNSVTDAFYCQQLAYNSVSGFRGVSDGATFEYVPWVNPVTTIFNADYTAAQGYVDGALNSQLNYKWAAHLEQVNTNGSGTVSNSGGFDRSGYFKGARSGNGTPSATGSFNAGDVLWLTFDYQFTLPGNINMTAPGWGCEVRITTREGRPTGYTCFTTRSRPARAAV